MEQRCRSWFHSSELVRAACADLASGRPLSLWLLLWTGWRRLVVALVALCSLLTTNARWYCIVFEQWVAQALTLLTIRTTDKLANGLNPRRVPGAV